MSGNTIVTDIPQPDGSIIKKTYYHSGYYFNTTFTKDDKFHNPNGPAVITVQVKPEHRGPDEEREEWWIEGKRHRVGGPAVSDGGVEEYWEDGQLHNSDGPAKVWRDAKGRKIREWWEHGVEIKWSRVEKRTIEEEVFHAPSVSKKVRPKVSEVGRQSGFD